MRKIIYLWCAPIGRDSQDVIGYAVTKDGECIASHWSSNPDWSKHDMGLTSEWKHDAYLKACPNGYSLVWLDDPESDEGWQRAFELNKQRNAAPQGREG